MATSYTGLRVQDTYNAIIKIGDNSNLTGTPKLLSDGLGNDSPLYLSGTRLGIGITPAYQFHTSGNAKIGGNLIISGNLTVNGTLTYLNVTDLQVEDPLIKLAKDNTSNTLDIGFFGKYVESATTKYTGLFWDASTDKFRLYEGLQVEPTTTVDVTGTGYTRSLLNANLEGNVTGTVSSLSNHDTNDLVEGSVNLYYTTARFDTRFTSKDTDNLSEGTTNLYFTTTRARASFTDGTGVTITDGEIAIGQAVATDSNVTFGNITGSAISGTTGTFSDDVSIAVSKKLKFGGGNHTYINEDIDDRLRFFVGGSEFMRFTEDTADTINFYKTATFSGLVSGIAPTSDLNFATKKYVDDNIPTITTPALSAVLAAGNTSGANNIIMADDQKVFLGTDSDLEIYHDGTDGYIDNINGELIIQNNSNDKKIIFKSDNGIGDITEYFRIDGNINRNVITVTTQLNDNVPLIFGSGAGSPSIKYDSTASQLFISGESKFLNNAYVVGNLGVGTGTADSPIHVNKGGLDTTGQDYGVHIGVLESGANRYSAIEIVSNGALSGWIDFSNTDSANDYNERIRGGAGTLRFFSSGEEAAYIDSSQHANFNEDVIVTSNDHNITTIEANENSTHFGRLHYMHSDFTTAGTNIADSLLLVASSESTGGIVIRADKPGSEIVFAIGDSTATNTVMKITDGANGVEFFPTSTAEGGHIALRADTDGSYRYAIDNYNDTVRIVRQADADATGGVVVANVDGNGDFSVTRDFTAGRTGYFTSNSADSRVLYLDQHAADGGNIVQFRDNADTYVWELVGRNNQFYIYNNSLSRFSLYVNPTNNFIGINGNSTPKAFLHVTDGTNSYPTDSNNKLVVESTGHTYIGLGGGDSSDVGIHFGDSTAVNRGRLAYTHSDDSMKISTNGAVRYIFDGYGSVAYNSVLKQSNGTWRNFGFGSLRMFGRANADNPDGGIGTNFYFTTANAELRVSAHAASRIWFNDDVINFDNAGTGLIDSAITWNNRMKIDSSGNVMMGKDIQSGNAALTVKSSAGGNTGVILIEGDTTNDGHGLYATTDNKFVITRFTNGSYSDNFVIDGAGNLGIGVTNPGNFYPGNHNLVVGDGNADSAITVYSSDLNTGYLLFADGSSGNTTYTAQVRYNHTTNHMEFATNNSTSAKMTLDENGLLGIGSTNPGRGITIDKSNEFASLEIIKNNSGNQIVYLGTGSSGTGENSILQLKDGTVEKIRMYSTGTSWITGGNLVIGNTSSTYDFEVYGTDAKAFVHYNGNSRGGIAAFSSQRIAMTTTSINDNLVFGYNSGTAASADFVERMRIDNGTGNVGIGISPQRLLHLRSTNEATGIFLERSANYGFVQYNQVVGSVETYHLGFVNNNTFSSDILVANESGKVGIANSSPGAFLTLGTYNVAGKYINITNYPNSPSQHMLHLTAPSTTNRYGGGISFGENTFTAANIVAIDAGGGGALHLAFGTGDAVNGMTERLRIDNGGTVIAKAELRANTSVRVFGNNVTDISATNSPTTTSVNLGTYTNQYSFIDLSSSNSSGSWIDFSNANGTDYGGRIRYNFTNSRMSFSAGTGERFRVNVGTTTALNTLEAAGATYSALIGSASFSWAGLTTYPTIYGSNADRWVMFTFPHISCLQNGVNGYTGSTTGAKIRFASNPAASSHWDAGVDLQYNAADRFSIGRAGAIMINCLTPNSTYSGLASRDWTIFGSGSRAGAIVINDIAGANYAIYGGGYDLTFSKSVSGTSLASALTILGDNAADATPDIQIHNNLTVNGTASVDGTASIGNAATIDSNTSSRVLYLRQQSANAGNIVQFQDQSSNNTWELVGRNNIFYLYNNMNSVGYVLNVRADNGYLKIGNSNNASYHLDVEGTIRASSDVIAFSDKRVKENIITIDSALDKVTKLRGVTYTRKDIDDKSNKIGVIAQEVLEVLPEIVSKDDEGMYSVAYGNMAGVFIEAIKELKAEVDNLKQEIKELKK